MEEGVVDIASLEHQPILADITFLALVEVLHNGSQTLLPHLLEVGVGHVYSLGAHESTLDLLGDHIGPDVLVLEHVSVEDLDLLHIDLFSLGVDAGIHQGSFDVVLQLDEGNVGGHAHHDVLELLH